MPPADHPDTLIRELRKAGMLELGERVLVAFSGGPDSTALLVALQEEGHDVVAAHFDHALQAGSAVVAEQAARLCDSLGIALVTERRMAPFGRGSVQDAARALRYDFLSRAADGAGARKVALAHTADDVVEGTVMHLLRGCGIAGLRGMPRRRGRFVRPMLDVWRSDVVAFLGRRGITAHEDPANSNQRFTRVRVRCDLLPALERDRPGITRRFHAVAARAAVLQDAIARDAARLEGNPRPSLGSLKDMSEPVAVEALRSLYSRAGGPQPGLARTHVHAMRRLIAGGPGGRGLDLPGGLRFRIVDSHAEVVPRVFRLTEPSLEIRECTGCTQADAAHLRVGLELTVGFRRPGLRMRPAGGVGTRKLQDIFVDAHVPREDRDAFPLVFAGDRLAWVPGIAIDRDLQGRAGQTTLHVTVTRILSAGSNKWQC